MVFPLGRVGTRISYFSFFLFKGLKKASFHERGVGMGVGWVGNKNQSFTGVGVGVGRCGGKINEQLQPANSRPHANFRKNKKQKALNRILTLPNYSTGPGLLISSGINY